MSEATNYISVDTIPELAAEREQVRSEAWQLVRRREQLHESGHDAELPLALDALSTAERVVEARDIFGANSEEYSERLEGLRLDCRRLTAEWFRKKRPEYFPATRHYFDEETGDFYSHGLSIRQMTENALRPIGGSHEEVVRRVNERVEDETPRIIRKIGSFAMAQFGIRTISECTDKAINDYRYDMSEGKPHRGYDGYVPEIEKVMIRDMRFDQDTGDRLQEQIGLPGIYISHWVIQETLRRRGVETVHMDKTELHGNQLLVDDDLMDFARQLDEVAGEEWCTNIFMGEVVPDGYEKDYENFRADALVRQEGLADTADTVASFVLDLAEEGFDKRKAPVHVEDFVKKLLLDIARQDLGVAEQMFDERTAKGLHQVNQLQMQGAYEEAFSLMQEVERQAPGGGFCSGGSCGLESVNPFSADGKRLAEKVGAKPGDTLVKDKERSCKCGSKSIIYAYNKSRVNKYCGNCDAFESKQTTGKSK